MRQPFFCCWVGHWKNSSMARPYSWESRYKSSTLGGGFPGFVIGVGRPVDPELPGNLLLGKVGLFAELFLILAQGFSQHFPV